MLCFRFFFLQFKLLFSADFICIMSSVVLFVVYVFLLAHMLPLKDFFSTLDIYIIIHFRSFFHSITLAFIFYS